MMFRFALMLVWTFVTCVGGYVVEPVLAGKRCSVSEVVKKVKRGNSRREIRKQCSSANVKKCSLTQVIKMAEKGKGSRAIYKKCKRG